MIKTNNLVKQYGSLTAVAGIDLHIKPGVFYGLLGPNGAGKTTTIKMLTLLSQPTSGDIYLDDQLLTHHTPHLKSMYGVVPQHFSLQKEQTLKETLILHGLLHKMPRKKIKAKMTELVEFAGMASMLNKDVAHLSGGNKRKLMIIRAMMHEPKILFLDEPTVGLDPSIRRDIWDLLKAYKKQGLTLLLTTHYIEEARQLCDTIAMMNHGVIIKEDTPTGYLNMLPPYTLEIFDADTTDYKYFQTKEDATKYMIQDEGELFLRKTNLEDVYIKETNQRLGE